MLRFWAQKAIYCVFVLDPAAAMRKRNMFCNVFVVILSIIPKLLLFLL